MITYITYCSGKKRSGIHRVEELYLSSRVSNFIKACRSKGLPWAILSARHGLLFPGALVESYDVTLRSMNCKGCFLSIRVLIDGKRLSIEESNRHLRDLCTRISYQLTKHGVNRVVFYAPNPYRARSYIKILQSALEDCHDLPVNEDIVDYVKKKNQIKIVTRLGNLVDGAPG